MSVAEMILSVILWVLAAASTYLGIRHLMCRGYLINNAYIFASEIERSKMDKTPYYKQSGICFLLISSILCIDVFMVRYHPKWLLFLMAAVTAATVIYAVASSAMIDKKNK